METQEYGESSPVRNEEKGSVEDEVTASPGSKGDSQEAEDECAVCRNGMVDVTTLSDCVHMFCYDCILGWLTHGNSTFCPMCKTPVKFIKKKETGEVTTLAEIQASKAPAPKISRDLITEKRMIARKMRACRRLMNRLDELISVNNRANNKDRLEELQRMKQLVVSQLNSLQMLREGMESGAVKSMIVSNVDFRRLVYERCVDADGILGVSMRKPTSQELLQNIDHFRTVFFNFMNNEIKALPYKLQMKVDNENIWHFITVHDELKGKDEEVINALFSTILKHGVANLTPRHIEAHLPNQISLRVAAVLLGEIVSLLSSRMSYLEWCGAVTYRSHADTGGEVNDNEVVVVDDNNEDPPAQERREFSRRHFAPFDRVFDLVQPSILFNRPEDHVDPSSDSDQDDPIYFQAPLRLQQPMVSTYRPQAHVVNPTVPKAGIPWDQLTGSSSERSLRPRFWKKPVQVVDLENEDSNASGSKSSSPDDIQVVDPNGTIILGDTPDSRAGTSTRSRASKRVRQEADEAGKMKRSRIEPSKDLVDDIRKLIEKHSMETKNSLNLIVDATQTALDQMKSTGKLKEELPPS